MRITITTGWLKFIVGWSAVFLFRLIPWRPPNVEPMLSVVMPFSKRFGPVGSFLFGFLGIALFDAVTSGWGTWTVVTAFSYGFVGLAAHYYFMRREATTGNFLRFGVPATVAYDAATGLTIGPLFHHDSFMLALTGQIPFTILHLLGTVVFSVILSPAIYRWVVQNETLEIPVIASSEAAG